MNFCLISYKAKQKVGLCYATFSSRVGLLWKSAFEILFFTWDWTLVCKLLNNQFVKYLAFSGIRPQEYTKDDPELILFQRNYNRGHNNTIDEIKISPTKHYFFTFSLLSDMNFHFRDQYLLCWLEYYLTPPSMFSLLKFIAHIHCLVSVNIQQKLINIFFVENFYIRLVQK